MKKNRIQIKDIKRKTLDRREMQKIMGGTEWTYVMLGRYSLLIEESVKQETGWNIYENGKG